MDEIRRAISDRLKAKGLTESEVSIRLGKNRAYMNQYLNGTQQKLPLDVRLKLAEIIEMTPQDLGVPDLARPSSVVTTGLASDAEPYTPPANHWLARSPHIAYYRVLSKALDQHPERIMPGHILAFDTSRTRVPEMISGTIIVAQLVSRPGMSREHAIVIRQYIAPNKLITNSSGENEIISLDDSVSPYEPRIAGVLLSVVREIN